MLSVGLSVGSFCVEVVLVCVFRRCWAHDEATRNFPVIHIVMASVHLGGEDTFQTVVYGVVATSQAHGTLGLRTSSLVGVLQGAAFTLAKVVELSGALDLSGVCRTEERRVFPAPQ
mmetsp:Transcript_47266/g.109371  ORF Transcript_47266/g.109371 Transcript_47266/m.109371 type:complete len:116 (-) Transcript_47266:123-470(-)